jgi:hypothetical protein
MNHGAEKFQGISPYHYSAVAAAFWVKPRDRTPDISTLPAGGHFKTALTESMF